MLSDTFQDFDTTKAVGKIKEMMNVPYKSNRCVVAYKVRRVRHLRERWPIEPRRRKFRRKGRDMNGWYRREKYKGIAQPHDKTELLTSLRKAVKYMPSSSRH